MRWNPCGFIHYVVNLDGAPPALGSAGALAEIQWAVGQVSAATGIPFTFDGLTDEPASTGRRSTDPRYPGAWAPVLIAYGSLSSSGNLGLTQTRWAAPDGVHNVAYTGWVTIDRDNADIVPGSDTAWGHARILLHELGHLVGLAHSPEPGTIMNAAPDGVGSYTGADLAGLAAVGGAAGCLPDVRPPS